MFEHGTIKINQQLSGIQDQLRIDADLSCKIRVYAPQERGVGEREGGVQGSDHV